MNELRVLARPGLPGIYTQHYLDKRTKAYVTWEPGDGTRYDIYAILCPDLSPWGRPDDLLLVYGASKPRGAGGILYGQGNYISADYLAEQSGILKFEDRTQEYTFRMYAILINYLFGDIASGDRMLEEWARSRGITLENLERVL